MAGHKLRRERRFDRDGAIRSARPTADAPHSRRVDGAEAERPGVAPPFDQAVNTVVCAPADLALASWPEDWCACAVTSPPYWNTVDYGVPGQIGAGSYAEYLDALDRVWVAVERALRPNGKLCVNVPLLPLSKSLSARVRPGTHTRVIADLYSDIKQRIERSTTLQLYSLYIWDKQTTEKMFGSYPYPPNLYERNTVEFIAVFVKPGKPPVLPKAVKEASRLTSEEWMDLTRQVWWMYPENVPRLEGHPAPFPEALPARLVAMYTFAAAPGHGFDGDIVLDPFCGSGTACVAAKRLGRRFVGIDLNPSFCDHARKRLTGVEPDRRIPRADRPGERRKG